VSPYVAIGTGCVAIRIDYVVIGIDYVAIGIDYVAIGIDYVAMGIASFGPTSLKTAPFGSAASAWRPYGVSTGSIRIEPPCSVISATDASVSSTAK
jgi:hypothetical protein